MYSVIFESDNGKKFLFGKDANIAFDMNLGDGVPTEIGTSQGFLQVGQSVNSQKVSGRRISVKGVMYGDVQNQKKQIRNVFSPFSSGKLIFQGRYYTRAYVQTSPTFSPVKNDGRFSMQLFAPFPFFYDVDTKALSIGGITKKFSFPVNFNSHSFGEKSLDRYVNAENTGDVSIPFEIFMQSTGTSINPIIQNLNTLQFLKLNGIVEIGDTVKIYRNNAGVLKAELERDGEMTDIISWIDEKSTLFELNVGDNIISATDDNGGLALDVKFNYNIAVVSLYED